ncbi:NAD(P)/FAD-dependent oxidoreductase [Streptomyces sp. NPDC014995]|uniref:NAD(P)/FAD-dependent oxidoreductase n=1 Tax=Streptomyces sp. NPDC014995 TaxID=3364936 RepID=UPI0036FBCA03
MPASAAPATHGPAAAVAADAAGVSAPSTPSAAPPAAAAREGGADASGRRPARTTPDDPAAAAVPAAPRSPARAAVQRPVWFDGAEAVGAAESALPPEPPEPAEPAEPAEQTEQTEQTEKTEPAASGPVAELTGGERSMAAPLTGGTARQAPAPASRPARNVSRHTVAVLGAHLGGGMLAAVLARAGVDTVLVDSPHDAEVPAGETTVPYTAEVFELLARRYGVPELSTLGHFGQLPAEVRTTSGVKRSIGFVYARPGARVRPHQVVQFNVPSEHGESHLYRPDVDAWVHGLAVRYGAKTAPGRPAVTEVTGEAGDFTVELADGGAVGAAFVVDMSGPDAPLLDRLGPDPALRPLRHSTRVLTAHLRGVRPLEQRVDPGEGGTPWTGGTTQVVFPGGWIQLVPFGEDRTSDTALTSVAVSLDAKRWPQRSASPEEDFEQLVSQFPDLAWQFEKASAVRPWTGAESWQYAANAAVGDGFVVLDRSAVRCDFTLSRDVTLTAELVHEAAAHIIAAARDGDWSAARFRPLETFQAGLIEHGERLLRTALTATTDFRLWNAFCRVWLLHSMFAALSLKRARNDALATGDRPDRWRELGRNRGAGMWFPVYAGFVALFDDTDRLLRQVADQRLAPGAAAERIFGQLRSAAFVPPLFGFGDPTDRYYNFTPLKRVKVLLWAKRRAPHMVRRVLTPGATVLPSTER